MSKSKDDRTSYQVHHFIMLFSILVTESQRTWQKVLTDCLSIVYLARLLVHPLIYTLDSELSNILFPDLSKVLFFCLAFLGFWRVVLGWIDSFFLFIRFLRIKSMFLAEMLRYHSAGTAILQNIILYAFM